MNTTADDNVQAKVLDVKGLICPEPVMMLHNAIRDSQSGDVLEILATDPSTERDIPKFCEFLGHELLSAKTEQDVYTYRVKKG